MTATHCHTMQHTATHGNKPQHPATHCNILQSITESYSRASTTAASIPLSYDCNTLQHTATQCKTLQRTATHCNTLQHTATQCNALQHTATQCNTLQHTAEHHRVILQSVNNCRLQSAVSIRKSARIMRSSRLAVCYSVLQRVAVCCNKSPALNAEVFD